MKTPKQLGFRMPAEWEEQDAIWMAWPHDENTWENPLEIEDTFVSMIKELYPQKVKLLVNDDAEENQAKNKLKKEKVQFSHVELWKVKNVDAWMRDCGPIFVVNDKTKKKAAIHWIFNAWGNKYEDLKKDSIVPEILNKTMKLELFKPGIVLEGGSIDVNGNGICLTSKQCLLNKNRNPHLSKEQIENYLKDYLGVNESLWVNRGIEGDDTDGHIDDIARFTDEKTILCCTAPKDDPNYDALKENFEILKKDKRFKVIELPMPYAEDEDRILPVSYANFLIANKVVLVPTFSHENDKKALDIIQKCFPTRKIIGIECSKLVYGGGTIHCRTQQEPKV